MEKSLQFFFFAALSVKKYLPNRCCFHLTACLSLVVTPKLRPVATSSSTPVRSARSAGKMDLWSHMIS